MHIIVLSFLALIFLMPETAFAQKRAVVYYDADVASEDAANQTPSLPQYTDIPAYFASQFHNNLNRENFVLQNIQRMRGVAANRNFITKEDVERESKLASHRVRHSQLVEGLAYDLNFDGSVTLAEIHEKFKREDELRKNRPNPGNQDNRRADIIKNLMSLDTNGDDVLSYVEMSAPVSDTKTGRRSHENDKYDTMSLLMELDLDGDGKVSVDDVQTRSQNVFSSVDLDKDGLLSQEEHRLLSESGILVHARHKVTCKASNIPRDARFVSLAIDGSQVISSATIAGQNTITTVADLDIAADDKPIYLYLLSRNPMIWNITGNIDRVERVYLSKDVRDGQGSVFTNGLINVSKEKVTFLSSTCLHSFGTRNVKEAKLLIKQIFGRTPDLIAGEERTQLMRLYNDRVEFRGSEPYAYPPMENIDLGMFRNFRDKYPGGIRDIKAADVASATRAENYHYLPGPLGLNELIQKGKLSHIQRNQYEIISPFSSFPAGLDRIPNLRFRVKKDILLPKYELKSACFIPDFDDRDRFVKAGMNICREGM